MHALAQIAVFGAAVLAGFSLGGVFPKALIKKAWQLPIAAIFIIAGIAIALLAWSP